MTFREYLKDWWEKATAGERILVCGIFVMIILVLVAIGEAGLNHLATKG